MFKTAFLPSINGIGSCTIDSSINFSLLSDSVGSFNDTVVNLSVSVVS